MTTYDNTRSIASGFSLGGMISSLIGNIAAWNDARVTRRALTSLTSRELEDIGLSYGDIDTIVARGTRR